MQKCKSENQTFAEAKLAAERRAQQQEEIKASQKKTAEAQEEDNAVLDSLLEKLKGDNLGRKRRARPSNGVRPAVPLTLNLEAMAPVGPGNDTVDIARDMLARLKSDGFEAFTPRPETPTSSVGRRTRRRRGSQAVNGEREIGGILLSQEVGEAPLSDEESLVPQQSDTLDDSTDPDITVHVDS